MKIAYLLAVVLMPLVVNVMGAPTPDIGPDEDVVETAGVKAGVNGAVKNNAKVNNRLHLDAQKEDVQAVNKAQKQKDCKLFYEDWVLWQNQKNNANALNQVGKKKPIAQATANQQQIKAGAAKYQQYCVLTTSQFNLYMRQFANVNVDAQLKGKQNTANGIGFGNGRKGITPIANKKAAGNVKANAQIGEQVVLKAENCVAFDDQNWQTAAANIFGQNKKKNNGFDGLKQPKGVKVGVGNKTGAGAAGKMCMVTNFEFNMFQDWVKGGKKV
ncbi:hypothetical protein HK104_001533 [Borealophlyctis nickersoniae]|nr:hypothetical protein HK104_001533 [Borealophlyctis nickersoniae]